MATCAVAVLALMTAPAAAFAPGAPQGAALRALRVPPVRLQLPFGASDAANEEMAMEMDIERSSEASDAPAAAPASERDASLFEPFSEMELAEQEAKLTALSEKWKRIEEEADYQASIRSGFGPSPELINGRTAMFFIIVGLITEYYTGQSMPQQVTTMLQTLSIIE